MAIQKFNEQNYAHTVVIFQEITINQTNTNYSFGNILGIYRQEQLYEIVQYCVDIYEDNSHTIDFNQGVSLFNSTQYTKKDILCSKKLVGEPIENLTNENNFYLYGRVFINLSNPTDKFWMFTNTYTEFTSLLQ